MLRLPGSFPIGGREAVDPPPPLLLPDPQPPSMAAPPSDAAPARNDRRSSLLVMEPPSERDHRSGRDECNDNDGRSPDLDITITHMRRVIQSRTLLLLPLIAASLAAT